VRPCGWGPSCRVSDDGKLDCRAFARISSPLGHWDRRSLLRVVQTGSRPRTARSRTSAHRSGGRPQSLVARGAAAPAHPSQPGGVSSSIECRTRAVGTILVRFGCRPRRRVSRSRGLHRPLDYPRPTRAFAEKSRRLPTLRSAAVLAKAKRPCRPQPGSRARRSNSRHRRDLNCEPGSGTKKQSFCLD